MRPILREVPAQTELLQVRLLDAQKRAIVRTAEKRGLTISEFVRRTLADASKSQAAA